MYATFDSATPALAVNVKLVAFLTTGGGAGTEFSITELGMPHADTGTE